jgi:hypothetical protein
MLKQTADGSKEKGCLPEFRGSIKERKVAASSDWTERKRASFLNRPKEFSIKLAWDGIRSRSPVVNWHHLVWHSKSLPRPRHSFILCLAIRGRLSTQDQQSWHHSGSKEKLCGEMEERLGPFVFLLPLLWSNMAASLREMQYTIPCRSWEETLQGMAMSFKGKSLRSLNS